MIFLSRMIRSIPLMVLVMLAGTAKSDTNIDIEGLRFGKHAEKTRIVLDVSGPGQFSVFPLTSPHRIVIDIENAQWRLGKKPSVHKIDSIIGYRTGKFRPHIARLVVETREANRVLQSFLLEPDASGGYRIVLDIAPNAPSRPSPSLKIPAPSDIPLPLYGPQARLSPSPRPPEKQISPQYKPMIVIDAGHGGSDPGAISKTGRYEKQITLGMARELKQILLNSGKYRVKLTRSKDKFLHLRDRIDIARKAQADVFLSLHADSIQTPQTRGLSVYTLSEQSSDKEAEALARRENKADLITGIDLTDENAEVTNILIDLAQRETMNQSAYLAEYLIESLGKRTRLLRKTHRFAGFVVLKAPDVPSILIELGYLSNPTEEKLLFTQQHRLKLAQAILEGLNDYFTWQQQFQ